ncbi:hypothetical protein ATN37_06200 [Rhodococcus sp. MH15]|nr:hypothetical protein [Rhodococcus sp. MH15]
MDAIRSLSFRWIPGEIDIQLIFLFSLGWILMALVVCEFADLIAAALAENFRGVCSLKIFSQAFKLIVGPS